jgi:hypothetical protein
MYVAKHDYTVNLEDNRELNKKLDSVVDYQEFEEHDHMSFFIGQDVSYMDKMVDLIQ